MKRLFAAVLAMLLPNAAPASDDTLHEASTNFDKKHVVPFLGRVSALFDSGFGASEVKKVAAMMEKMKLDEEKELTFSVQFKGSSAPLKIRLFMDDIDAIDLYVFSSKEVAARVMELIKSFAEEHAL